MRRWTGTVVAVACAIAWSWSGVSARQAPDLGGTWVLNRDLGTAPGSEPGPGPGGREGRGRGPGGGPGGGRGGPGGAVAAASADSGAAAVVDGEGRAVVAIPAGGARTWRRAAR